MNADRPNGHHSDHQPAIEPDKQTVRLTGPGQLLAAIPYLLGFHPDHGSVVVVGLRDARVVVLARIDLPHPGHLDRPGDAVAFWALFARALAANDATQVSIIGYTDSARQDDLYRLADTAPIPTRDLLRVMHQRWWSLNCPDPRTCPHEACKPWGDPLTPAGDDVTAPLIAAGAGIPGTRADLDRILRPGPEHLVDAVAAHLPLAPAPARQALFQTLTAAHAACTDGPLTLEPGQAAVLLHALSDPWIRDAALAWTDDAAWWLWTELIHTAPHHWIAPVATVIAVTAYQRGDGVMAAIAAEHALLDRADYKLAHLVLGCLSVAVTPDQITTFITEAIAELPADLRPRTTP